MLEFVLTLSILEFLITPTYSVKVGQTVIKEFDSMNSKAQCENYAKWYGGKAKCILHK